MKCISSFFHVCSKAYYQKPSFLHEMSHILIDVVLFCCEKCKFRDSGVYFREEKVHLGTIILLIVMCSKQYKHLFILD